MDTDKLRREIAIGRIPPVIVDAEHLRVDAAAIHALEPRLRGFRHILIGWEAAFQRRSGQQFGGFGHHHVAVDVDHLDRPAIDANLLA